MDSLTALLLGVIIISTVVVVRGNPVNKILPYMYQGSGRLRFLVADSNSCISSSYQLTMKYFR